MDIAKSDFLGLLVIASSDSHCLLGGWLNSCELISVGNGVANNLILNWIFSYQWDLLAHLFYHCCDIFVFLFDILDVA